MPLSEMDFLFLGASLWQKPEHTSLSPCGETSAMSSTAALLRDGPTSFHDLLRNLWGAPIHVTRGPGFHRPGLLRHFSWWGLSLHDPGNVNHAVDELRLRHQHCVLMSLDRGDLSLCHHANIHDSASDLDLWSSHCLLHLLDPGSPSLHLYRDRDVIGAIKKLSLWNFNRFVGFLDERWAAALASRRCMNDVGNVLNLWHVHRFLHSLNGGNGSLHHDGNIQNSVNERHLWDLGRPLHLLEQRKASVFVTTGTSTTRWRR